MKEDKTIKKYSDKIMKLVNQLRLLGEDLSERRIVNKVLVSLPEKFEAKISSLEDSKDLSQLTVAELVNALQAQEQRRSIRNGGQMEGAFMVRSHGKVVSNSQRRYDHDKKEKDRRNSNEKQGKDIAIKWDMLRKSCCANDAILWHKRLGHVNYGSLKLMASNNLVNGLPIIGAVDHICEICQFGKQNRNSFPKSSDWRARTKLQLIHSDVGGPMRTPSLNESLYYLIFIDDLTRFCWVYFMKKKSEVFDKFIRFKAMVENEIDLTMKILRTDNGQEFCSKEFEDFLTRYGIKHHRTVSYSPQQNGVSERKNKTLVEMARCLLLGKNLPTKFWVKVVNVVVNLLNVLPTKALDAMSPYEAWNGEKPSVAHLRVFGSIYYAKVPDEKRKKFDSKSQVAIHLGFSDTSKGYRLFNVHTNKVFISRDVKFDEDHKWNWEKGIVESSRNFNITADVLPQNFNDDEDIEDENLAVRGTRSLQNIYERCSSVIMEPNSFTKASKDKRWLQAMHDEIEMIKKNQTWHLVDRPANQKVIGVKWVFKTKLNVDGMVNKYKARLVAKGYAQEYGVDFSVTFAPVARHDTIRLLTALVAKESWKIWHLDVKSAFLNGFITEYVYIEQPEDSYVVDDFKVKMNQEFEMTDLGEMTFFLGMEFIQKPGYIGIHQTKYAKELLKQFKMESCKAVDTLIVTRNKLCKDDGSSQADSSNYRSLVGCILYLTTTRPYIMYAASVLSRFMQNPSELHLIAAKCVLRYIKGTYDYGLKYFKKESKELLGFCDSDWAGSLEDSRSTTGYCFSLCSAVFTWSYKKQEIVAQSSAEVEYIAAVSAANHAVWLRKMLYDLGFEQNGRTKLLIDNQSALAIANNSVYHGRTKHIRVKYHAIQDAIKEGEIYMEHYLSKDQLADIMTNGLNKDLFVALRDRLGVTKLNLKEVC
ncbi:Integrase [Theobroma cacao]|nr:Integrase [Theobroma cacao]